MSQTPRLRPAVRAIVISGDHLLVQRPTADPRACFAFIGGAYEPGDTLHGRIRREFEEETDARVVRSRYLFVVENHFQEGGGTVHSLEHYVEVELDRTEVRSREVHLAQHWLPLSGLAQVDLRPHAVRDAIVRGTWRDVRHLVVPAGEVPRRDVEWRLHLASPPERVHALLATDAGRASFWAEEAVEAGGSIHFRFADGTRLVAPVLRREPPALFELAYFGSVARFELAPDGRGGTDLRLTHEGVPEEAWAQTHAGWLNVLFPLKAAADLGADLRNHDPRRTWASGYVDG